MRSYLRVSKVWSDQDIVELRFEMCDGTSTFINKAYADRDWFKTASRDLRTFADQLHGGLYDLTAGSFGPEYANGAFLARFHFPSPGPLYVSCHQQSEYFEFKAETAASEAKLFIRSEPGLLDRFIQQLAPLHEGVEGDAILEGT